VVEELSSLPVDQRFRTPLIEKFAKVWQNFAGKKGGFRADSQEKTFFDRGKTMLQRVSKNPGPLKELAVKIKEELPWYWLSEEDEIILCGKIDWLEYLKETNSVHIIDFKTSQHQESKDSLQLPIYHLLVKNTQDRQVSAVSYWYLEFNDQPTEQKLVDIDQARRQIVGIAKKIKVARKLGSFKCPQGQDGCRYCKPLEKILAGEAESVGVGGYGRDLYIMPDSLEKVTTSEIL